MPLADRLIDNGQMTLAVCAVLLAALSTGCRDNSTKKSPAQDASTSGQATIPDVSASKLQAIPFPKIDLKSIDHLVAAAIQTAMDGVRQTPKSGDAWGHLGMVLLAHDLREIAAECFDRAGQLSPHEPRWPHFQARAIKVSDPLNAIPLMETAISSYSARSEAKETLLLRLQLAEMLIERNRLDAATEQVMQVLERDAKNARAHYEMGRLAFLKHDFAGCLKHLGRAESLGAIRKQGCLLAAEAHRRLGNVQAAENERSRAAKLRQSNWPDPFPVELAKLRTGLKARLVMAEQLYARQKVQASINVLKPTIQEYPDSAWARILLARAWIRLRQLTEAKKTLTEALELSPDSVEAHFRMGVILQLQKNYHEASKWFEKTLQLKPDFAMAHRNLGFCRMNLDELDAAVAALRRSVECQPDFVVGWKTLGQAEARRGHIEQARQAYQKALQLAPGNHEIRDRLDRLEELIDQ